MTIRFEINEFSTLQDAAYYMGQLTGSDSLNTQSFIAACINEDRLGCYVNAKNIYGAPLDFDFDNEDVLGVGFQKCLFPKVIETDGYGDVWFYLVGNVQLFGKVQTKNRDIVDKEWMTHQKNDSYTEFFLKNDELRALASTITKRPQLPEDIDKIVLQNSEMQEEIKELNCKIDELQNESLQKSAYLLIARAYELYEASGNGRHTQTTFVADLQGSKVLRGMSERTINSLLADANKAIIEARKH